MKNLAENGRIKRPLRLGFRGIRDELQWAVDLLEPLERLDAQAMRHLQFMVFEALSNVLQHAQASVVRIEANRVDGGVGLRIIDNGRGFDVQAPLRKGLLSLRDRAAAIGARLSLQSAPGRTVVDILIPAEVPVRAG